MQQAPEKVWVPSSSASEVGKATGSLLSFAVGAVDSARIEAAGARTEGLRTEVAGGREAVAARGDSAIAPEPETAVGNSSRAT